MKIPLLLFTCLLISCANQNNRQLNENEKKSLHIINTISKEIKTLQFSENTLGFHIDSVHKEWKMMNLENSEKALNYVAEFNASYQDTKKRLIKLQDEEIEYLVKNISKIKSKFNYTEDKANNVGFYNHKLWGSSWVNKNTLTSGVNSTGYIWLRSNYFSRDWLFHTSVEVFIDDKKYTSKVVTTYNKDYSTHEVGSKKWEVITYGNSEIIELIAKNYDKEIKVTFVGRNANEELILNTKDKQAIKDCYELSKYLKIETQNKKKKDS